MNAPKNPARRRVSASSKDYHLRKYYSLTEADYWKLHAQQDGKCAICQRGNRRLVVDHDHYRPDDRIATRGLLCYGCNARIAWFERFLRRDEWSRRAEAYLSAPPILGRVGNYVRAKGVEGEPPLAAASRRLRVLKQHPAVLA